ncbi:G2/mitotic-specific cyclin-B2-like isoform X2 [Petromyzon marinus]|uniref:G2/mitotic-specific cyclin-B2-like isoform X2 n=1 Tax=Petromyzon marinus TaxID=7757 RepID=UPI003F7086DE
MDAVNFNAEWSSEQTYYKDGKGKRRVALRSVSNVGGVAARRRCQDGRRRPKKMQLCTPMVGPPLQAASGSAGGGAACALDAGAPPAPARKCSRRVSSSDAHSAVSRDLRPLLPPPPTSAAAAASSSSSQGGGSDPLARMQLLTLNDARTSPGGRPQERDRHRELALTLQQLGMCSEANYANDLYLYMMRRHQHQQFRVSDVPQALTQRMRGLLVDWLVQVQVYFDMSEETLYLAVYLLNAYLRVAEVHVPTLQLLGMTCLYVACKMEESSVPEVHMLCYLMEHTYRKEQLLRMERLLLERLKFSLYYVQPLHLLQVLLHLSDACQEINFLSTYLMELSLSDVDSVTFGAMQLAAGALCLARHVMLEYRQGVMSIGDGETAWTDTLSYYSSYSERLLYRCMHRMSSLVLGVQSSRLRSSYAKFSAPAWLGVSQCPALDASRFLKFCAVDVCDGAPP